MFRLLVAPDCCGRKVVRSVALRIPNFSMSCGRYVSTGLGPVSSAVGIFEPVTTTRSTSAVDGAAAPGSAGTAGAGNCANAFDARINGNPTLAIKARRTNLNVFSAFSVIVSPSGLAWFTKLNDCQVTHRCEARVFLSHAMVLGHKSGIFGHNHAGIYLQLYLISRSERARTIDRLKCSILRAPHVCANNGSTSSGRCFGKSSSRVIP